MKYLDGLDDYVRDLEGFVEFYALPDEWFAVPDHVAVKCRDVDDYRAVMNDFASEAEQRTEIEMDGRHLGTVKLLSSLVVGNFGDVAWVEVMEPRPAKVGQDVVGFEHMEFCFPDFPAIRSVLDERKISYEFQENPGHRWINIVINDRTQELKLNDRTLADVVTEELTSGLSKEL